METVRSPTKTPSYTTVPYSYIAYGRGLDQMNTGCLIVGSVSVGAFEPWLVDSVGRVLVVSLTPLAPSILLPLPLKDSSAEPNA